MTLIIGDIGIFQLVIYGNARGSVFEASIPICEHYTWSFMNCFCTTPLIIGCTIAVRIHVYHIHKIFKSQKISTKLNMK